MCLWSLPFAIFGWWKWDIFARNSILARVTRALQSKMQQVQPQPNFYNHAHPSPVQSTHLATNGIHPELRSQTPTTTNGRTNGADMNAYSQQYGTNLQSQQAYGNGGSQQQYGSGTAVQQASRQYYSPAQLPPLHTHHTTMAGSTLTMPPPLSSTTPTSHSAPPQSYAVIPGNQQMFSQIPASQSSDRIIQLSYSGENEKYKFTLKVEQQPQRARMCGFGDKDRRPITPPPCIRLVVTDKATGLEADFADIDGSFFVLQVDLWAEDASREVNIVRASTSSPAVSISTATTTSFPPTPERSMLDAGQPLMYYGAPGQQAYAAVAAPGYGNAHRGSIPGGQYSPGLYYPQGYGQPVPMMPSPQSTSMMFTRNLIGSLTVNASRLNDSDGKIGYWFVLQDLSVRTEGFFR